LDHVIIYRIGSLGDTIVSLPCFHKIAQSFPDAQRIVLTNFPVSKKAAPLEAILGDSGLIHRAIEYPIGARSPLRLWQLAREIRSLKASTLVYLMPQRGRFRLFRDRLFFRLCGLSRLVGYPKDPDLYTLRKDPATGFCERECERLARTLRELGPIDLNLRECWDLKLTDREMAAGKAIIDSFGSVPFIALNMGGKLLIKDWGEERWSALLAALAKNYSAYGLLVVGGVEESTRAAQAAKNWPNFVVNTCGTLSPRESAAVLRGASIFVGHDSGPLHLAAASNVRCVGLFGNYNWPRKWHPYGAQHRIIHRFEGMAAISVAEVAQAVAEILGPGMERSVQMPRSSVASS
jgi:heptosyltransferase III